LFFTYAIGVKIVTTRLSTMLSTRTRARMVKITCVFLFFRLERIITSGIFKLVQFAVKRFYYSIIQRVFEFFIQLAIANIVF